MKRKGEKNMQDNMNTPQQRSIFARPPKNTNGSAGANINNSLYEGTSSANGNAQQQVSMYGNKSAGLNEMNRLGAPIGNMGAGSRPANRNKEQEERDENQALYAAAKARYTKTQFLNQVFITEAKYDQIVSRLLKKKNIILQGAPGVGKSFLAKRLAYSILGKRDEDRVAMIQFHQSYAYEDFIMGYRPTAQGGFQLEKGVFYSFCRRAKDHPDEPYFFIIDEINRGNLSKIFGELFLLIELDKRGKKFAMPTTYSKELFYIPENLHIIGLMNTADRSLALIDYALRRRFSFIDIEPAFGQGFNRYMERFAHTKLSRVIDIIMSINEIIEHDETLGKGFKIGHSYFCNLTDGSDEELLEIIDFEIVPLLEEYWVEDAERVRAYADELRGAVYYD